MESRAIHRLLLTVVFVCVPAALSLAHDVSINDRARLGNGPELQSGTYRLELVKNQNGSECLFYKGGDMVVRVPTTVVMESKKSPQTSVHAEVRDSGRVITQIRIAGWRETLLFEPPAQRPVTDQ